MSEDAMNFGNQSKAKRQCEPLHAVRIMPTRDVTLADSKTLASVEFPARPKPGWSTPTRLANITAATRFRLLVAAVAQLAGRSSDK